MKYRLLTLALILSILPAFSAVVAAVTGEEIAAWKSFLAVSPLSSDHSTGAAALRAKAGNPVLDPLYASHIVRLANWSTRLRAANDEWAAESARITGNHEIGSKIAEFGVPVLCNGLRDHSSEETVMYRVFSTITEHGLVALAQILIEEDRRAQVRAAYVRIVGPLYEEGKQLTYEEHSLNSRLGVASSTKLSSSVRAYRDQDWRRVLTGAWSEHTLVFKSAVWAFYPNGNVSIYHTVNQRTESGTWQVSDGELRITSRSGAQIYRLGRDGRKMVLTGVGDSSDLTLSAESDNPSAFGPLVAQLHNSGVHVSVGGGFGGGRGFRLRFGR